ncbi:MAG: class C sortase [Lachnospiraceae bacterium]|nr:class C sortase [Lachnospiraceae bacterium]
MKKITVVLIIIAVLSFSLLLYPSFSNYWNSKHATREINTLITELDVIDNESHDAMLAEANEYNKILALRRTGYSLTDEQQEKYESLLNVTDNGVMGYLEISKLGVMLPIYHGTESSVLQNGIGHLNWSSLPVGGISTHSVVSGHRGLPSAKLLTDLDKMREGDLFTLVVLGDTLTYEVDQIRTVLPSDLSELAVTDGADYCTIVTCTPYGINTHRLLVRGHRVATAESARTIISEAVLVDQLVVATYLSVPLLFVLFLSVMLKKPKKKTKTPISDLEE